MTRFAIDRKNRDRKGGHESSSITMGPFSGGWTPVQRELAKRLTRKVMRRQHNKAINEGIAAYHQDLNDLAELYMGYDIEEDHDYQEWINGYEEPEQYDDYDFDNGYDSGPYYGLGDDFIVHDTTTARHWNDSYGPHDEFIHRVRPNVRLLDKRTAYNLVNEVNEGNTSLELEIVSQRDAGKTLGQLLRERLSLPF